MTVRVAGETKAKLDHVPQRLGEEFADVDADAVKQEVAEVADDLLDKAHFSDFVPLLAYRYTREHLLDEGHEPVRATIDLRR